MIMMTRMLMATALLLFLIQCQQDVEQERLVTSEEFGEYWYQGKAEVASYDLTESRYGQQRDGHAVLIFVTEPFHRELQVKLDDPAGAGEDKVTVMKLNMMKKFITGIYPYSMMLSVFSPADTQSPPSPLKFTMSAQEWCGQVFAQMNRVDNAYRLREFSYFQSEGDHDRSLDIRITEDEIWNRIRLDPSSLPQGDIRIYPGLFYTRLQHKQMVAEDAQASIRRDGSENVYQVEFANGRTITWRFDAAFPHIIRFWEERFPGRGGNEQVTTARLKNKLMIPYWQYNRREDIIWRDSLGIE